jgi:hypothetical protein
MRGAIPPLPRTSSWHSALLSTETTLPVPHDGQVAHYCQRLICETTK